MRSAGENAPGQTTGRRHAAADPDGSPQSAQGAQRHPGGGESPFAPGYTAGREPAPRRQHEPARPEARYGPEAGVPGKGPVRGYPPLPGQLPPLYPPGQFSAWNRHGGGGSQAQGTGDPGLAGRQAAPGPAANGHAGTFGQAGAEPGYSVLAVRDPAADVTATQTWDAVDGDQARSGWEDERAGGGRPGENGPGGEAGSEGGRRRTEQGQPAAAQRPARERREGGHRQAGALPAPEGAASGPGADQASPGAGRGSRRRGARGRASGRGGRTRRGLLAAGLAAAVAVGAGVYYLSRGPSRPPQAAQAAHGSRAASAKPRASASSPPASPSAAPLGPWGHIQTRAIDAAPLTLAELFPASYTVGGVTYGRTVRRGTASCAAAIVGSRLRSAVRSAGCSQVMRASYLSTSQQVMGTIGVLNLPSFQAAERAGAAAGPTQFIAQLPAARGLTRKLTKGTGIEEADVKGHYLILVWGEFTTLRAPATKARRTALETFLSSMINNTVNHSLTSRMVDGKPGVP